MVAAVTAGTAPANSLADALVAREAQWQRFAQWEHERNPADAEFDLDRVHRAVAWYADAFGFARRTGGIGPGTPETHLYDLVAWVRLWRSAWRVE